MVESIRDHISSTVGPKQILIRVNAGPIPLDHWMQDARIGGGRLIGEACHFVDLALYLSGAPIRTVHAVAIPLEGRSHALLDNFSIHLAFANASVATIVYTSVGDPGLPKEYVEVFAGGKVGIIHDFRSVELWKQGKSRRVRWSQQDKGQKSQIDAWVKGLRSGVSPIPFQEIVNVHQACLSAIESLRTGGVQSL